MEALKKEIGLTSLSQRDLNAELRRLNALKQGLTPFSKEFNVAHSMIPFEFPEWDKLMDDTAVEGYMISSFFLFCLFLLSVSVFLSFQYRIFPSLQNRKAFKKIRIQVRSRITLSLIQGESSRS